MRFATLAMLSAQAGIPDLTERIVGRRMYGGAATHIPLRINTAGVIPIIFASSVLLLPVLLTNIIGVHKNAAGQSTGIRAELIKLVNQYIVNSHNFVYIALFSLMIVAFAYFYNAIAFDPIKQADYYSFRAIFEPYQLRTDVVPGEADVLKSGIPRAFDCNLDAKTPFHIRGDERNPDKDPGTLFRMRLTVDELAEVAALLSPHMAYISVSGGSYSGEYIAFALPDSEVRPNGN